MKPTLLLLAVGIFWAIPHSAAAAVIEGVEFADAHRFGQQRLVLSNVALMRYQIVIKALVSALYLGEGVRPEDALRDVPKRLEIHYFWSLEGKEITKAAEQLLANNLSRPQIERVRREIDQMHSLFENVKAGDRYSLTYIPGAGTELALNGQRKGIVPGAEFAAAYFSIWLGSKPMDVAMRDTLLRLR